MSYARPVSYPPPTLVKLPPNFLLPAPFLPHSCVSALDSSALCGPLISRTRSLLVAYYLALQRQQRVRVFLTTLGGGAFGNRHAWISDAITIALAALKDAPLDVILVHYGSQLKADWKAIRAPSPSEHRVQTVPKKATQHSKNGRIDP